MSKTRSKTEKLPSKTKKYNDFINQIDIVDIRLLSVKLNNLGPRDAPINRRNEVRFRSAYENKDNTIEFEHKYYLTILNADNDEKAAKLFVQFLVIYATGKPMTDEIYKIFDRYNLPLNTWPYFREIAHNLFRRMDWPSVIAPTFKTLAKFA